MQVFINQVPYDLDAAATLQDALTAAHAQPPFAAAVNQQFVAQTRYASTHLREGDRIEIIAPITGG